MTDKQIAVSGDWALASDSVQWVLQRSRYKDNRLNWRPVSFVRTSKDILARCMREKGTPPADAERLLDGLLDHFEDAPERELDLV